MTDIDFDRLLGNEQDDPGCDEAGELMDAYCDAVSCGEPVSNQFDEFLNHMRNCVACREDMEGLLALLREQDPEGLR